MGGAVHGGHDGHEAHRRGSCTASQPRPSFFFSFSFLLPHRLTDGARVSSLLRRWVAPRQSATRLARGPSSSTPRGSSSRG